MTKLLGSEPLFWAAVLFVGIAGTFVANVVLVGGAGFSALPVSDSVYSGVGDVGGVASVRLVDSEFVGGRGLFVESDSVVVALGRVLDTGSMEPALSGGDSVVVVECGFGDVAVGDVVMFNASSAGLSGDDWVTDLVVHRVVGLDGVEECVVTRGDSNLRNDGCVGMVDVVGCVEVVVFG